VEAFQNSTTLPSRETEDVRVVDLDAPAAPAGREDYQRDTALVVGEDRLKVKMEQPAADDD
jgi:hypothetical protein